MEFAGTAERLMAPTVIRSTNGGPRERESKVPSPGDETHGLPVDPDIELGIGGPSGPPTRRPREHHPQMAIVFAVGGLVGTPSRYLVDRASAIGSLPIGFGESSPST